MGKRNKSFLGILSVIFITVAILYILFLTVFPKILSSPVFLNTIDDFLAKNTGIIVTAEHLKVKTYPSLVIDIRVDKFNINAKENELLKVSNALLAFDLKTLCTKRIDIEYIYINQKNFENILKENKNKRTSDFKMKKFPEVNISQVEIWADKGEINSVFVDIDNIRINNKNGKTKCTFEAEIISNLLKNTIYIGKNGYLYIKDNKLYADKLEILIGQSKLEINGKITDSKKKTNLYLYGNSLPVSDIMSSLLYFQKIRDNSKKFLENFYDYSGKINVNVSITEKGVFGECSVINLAAKSVLYNVPILFKHVPLIFTGREFKGGAFGTLGGEKVYSDFDLINMGTKEQEASGTVQSVITNKSVGRYVTHTSMKGSADASVDWHIKNQIINVDYKLYVPENSDIYYKNASLGREDKLRRLYVHTLKYDDKLKITKYEYSLNQKEVKIPIITGDGLFTKINGKMKPDFITCKTANDAPVTLAGSFYKYVQGGVFNGNLKYDFNKNKITGNFNIKNSVYKDYKIDEAKVEATNNKVIIEANGGYKSAPFSANIIGLNDFNKKIHIYKLYLFLDELILHSKKKKTEADKVKIDEKIIKKQTDYFDIDLYTVKLNKIKYKRVELKDILVNGSIKNNIFNFDVPHIKFAKGILKANGLYDFNKRTSDVLFSAENIDSNTVADVLFNLPEQIQGTANAKLKVKTKNGIENKKAHAEFTIKQGYLEKLGSTEFMIKHAMFSKKQFNLKDAINVDIKNMKSLASDIKGSFDIDNSQISNSNITSSQKYLSLLLQGDYNIETQNADLQLFGQYNRNKMSKIKVFFVPLSLIVKIVFKPEKTKEKYIEELKMLPKINLEDNDNAGYFRVKLNGNIPKNNFYLELKGII